MNEEEQAKTIEGIFILVNSITQDLIELQDEVSKLKVIEKEVEIPEEIKEVKDIKPLPDNLIYEFGSFTTELINAEVKGNLVDISYITSGKTATFNRYEIKDAFNNLPDKFDKETVKSCLENMGIESKNETLLMRFFVYQFKDYCEAIRKSSKDKLIIRKL